MPANRMKVSEIKKKEELIKAAQQLFITDGYEEASMSKIAKAANVAPNTLYWYFHDKDELLIAVLDNLLDEHQSQLITIISQPFSLQLVWLVENLQKLSRLVSTVHDRCQKSATINTWHQNFHHHLEQLLSYQIQKLELDIQEKESKFKIVSYTIEGLITHQSDPEEIRRVCDVLSLFFLN